MPAPFKVAVILGSLRKASLTRKLGHALIALAPDSIECTIVEIGDLSLYNEDLEQNVPPAWQKFRDEIRTVDAVLFVTPEYNRSMPGLLKNAIDIGSRPAKQSVWPGKAAGVVSVTPFKLGAMAANHALRQVLVYVDMPVMQQPEAYVSLAAEMFDESGALVKEDSIKIFTTFMMKFAEWVAKIRRA